MTIGTWLFTKLHGAPVGSDAEGNRYFQQKRVVSGRRRKRWVIYNGVAEASRVPPEWHGWLHHSYDALPESHLPAPKIWEADYTPNATGTNAAYRPQGALENGGNRARATGDYEAWTPEGASGE